MSEKRIAVIERCGQCCHSHYSQSEGWVCLEAKRELPEGWEIRGTAPPEWCPLTKAAEVAQVKPLVWQEREEFAIAGGRMLWCQVRKLSNGWRWRVDVGSGGFIGDWEPCDSLKDGKAKAEAAYRVALFGEGGPLERLS